MRATWATFTSESLLEAALIHMRCVGEFLRRTGQPEDTITVRDYVSDWHWKKGEALKADIDEIHGRIAHLGLVRLAVQREGEDFRWDTFLASTAVAALLCGFREFLRRLDRDMAGRFNQPEPHMERIDLVAAITRLIGPSPCICGGRWWADTSRDADDVALGVAHAIFAPSGP